MINIIIFRGLQLSTNIIIIVIITLEFYFLNLFDSLLDICTCLVVSRRALCDLCYTSTVTSQPKENVVSKVIISAF